MSALSVRLPESLHRGLADLAAREGISINQLITSAVAEKVSALMTEEFLEARAKRGSRREFKAALSKVADVPADQTDRPKWRR
jgi:predicted transcriptional regulator